MQRRALLAALAALAGCGATPSGDESQTAGTTAGETQSPGTNAAYGLPGIEPSGNPAIPDKLDLRTAETLDIALSVTPVWLAGIQTQSGSSWAAVLEDGSVAGLRVTEDGVGRFELTPERIDGPPLLVHDDDLRVSAPASLAAHTHPVPVAGGLAWVRQDRRLQTTGGTVTVDSLPDAVPVASGNRVFVLAEPTDSYDHGVLGDEIEAGSLAVVNAASGEIERHLRPPEGTVIEGRSAMLATLGGDPAAVVTASDATDGARIVALGVDGDWRAVGPPVGAGFRWRHQLAVAPFGPNDEQAIAAVKTPHIGGVAEFYCRDGDRLRLAATDDGGYGSHEIGGRNLGGGIAGRFAGDDRWLLLLPDQQRQSLVGVAWNGAAGVVEQVFSLPLDGALTTNVTAVRNTRETAVVAAGTESGVRFWRRR
ncbi:MAG: hypothetical protein ABEH90_08810 [Halolamina sp.]